MADEENQSWSTLEDEEVDEALFEDIGLEKGSPESSWLLDQGPIHSVPLDDIVKDIPNPEVMSKTGIRFMPSGLKTAFFRLKRSKQRSLEVIYYNCSRHGCMIAIRDARIKQVLTLYEVKLRKAEAPGDIAMLKRLEERNENADYEFPIKYSTSIVIPKHMSAILSLIADGLGVSNVKLFCWITILSLLTLKNPSPVKGVLEKESKHFWSLVEDRLKWLS